MLTGCSPGNEAQQADDAIAAADRVLTSGKIYTVDAGKPWAGAVAIRGDRFVFVGDDDGAREYIGKSTAVTDLDGRLVIPGIIDGHTHPGYIDLEQYGPPLPETSHEDMLAALKDYAEQNPDKKWIRMCCWPVERYVRDGKGPHKRDLDDVVPDRPVWIGSSAWHSAWLNSKALEVIGVDSGTPDPQPGVAIYARDESGELTGWVKEGAGWQHFATQFDVDAPIQTASIEAFLRTLSEHGVTTVYDAGNFGYGDHVYGFVAQLEKDGKLPLRYEGTYQIYVPERRQHAITEMKRLQDTYGGERLKFRTVKLFMDGVVENRSGAMLEPYSDAAGQSGGTMLSVDELRDFLVELHHEKFDIHIHAIGDHAVRDALDAVEAARAAVEGELYPRVTLSHLQYMDAAELPRFAELDVSANFTPWWHGYDGEDSAHSGLGTARSSLTYLARPLFDTGGNVTFSSDEWALDVLTPFLGMQVGHTRKYPDDWQDRVDVSTTRLPESEQLDLELMLRGYTINGAYPFRMEDSIGSIEAGKLADLVVLDDNLFEMDPEAIHKIKPAAVMMEGKVIHGTLDGAD